MHKKVCIRIIIHKSGYAESCLTDVYDGVATGNFVL